MAPKPTRRDLLRTTATLAATSALAFDRATVDQNKNILLWSETRYRFIKRQSQADPNVWVSLSNQQPAIATATSR
jgi:predicted transglutaminase-like cysteine proteinase